MKVLLVSSPPSDRGGISNWCRIAHDFFDTGKTPVEMRQIATRQYRGLKHGLWERFVANGFDLLRIKKELKRALRENRPDIVHITVTGDWSVIRDMMILKWAKKHQIPSVCHLRFGKLADYRQGNGRKWKMLRRSLSMCDAIWAIDQTTYTAARDAFPDKQVICIANPVELHDLPPKPTPCEKAISFVGWIVKTKGVEELLVAWKAVHARFPDYQLNMVGPYEDAYKLSLEERFPTEGVTFTGRLPHDETLELVAGSEIFVLPSYTEGFPNAVVEAMALRTPVIATDVGAIPDMLADRCGIVIPKQDVGALEKALEALLNDKKTQAVFAENAYRKVGEHYSVEAVFSQYMKEWQKIADNCRT